MGNKSFAGLLLVGLLVAEPVLATMPPNPERLLEVSTCSEAKRNLTKARAGSPLLSKAKNAAIAKALQKSVKRLCM